MGISENAVSFIWSALYEIAACIFRYVGSFLSGIVGATPRVMLSVAVFIISVIYLSIDYDRILRNASKLIPPAALPVIKRAASRVCFGLRQYVKACAILFFLTFIEAYVGLLILKGPYALLLSLVIAFVDILPIFGAGAVLIPWAAISFATGRASFGLGLLIFYGVVTAVRQIVEPYVVGEKMGVHPLASLLITFLLFYVFGPVGAFVSPLASLLLGQLLKKREE